MSIDREIEFAMMMAFLEEMEEEKSTSQEDVEEIEIQNHDTENAIVFSDIDDMHGKERLIEMAQKLMDDADETCNTQAEGSGEEFVEGFLTAIIFNNIINFKVGTETRIRMYDLAMRYCRIACEDETSALFGTMKEQLRTMYDKCIDGMISMLLIASNAAGNYQLMVGFFKAMAEYLGYVDWCLKANYPNIVLDTQMSVFFLERARSLVAMHKKEVSDDVTSLKEECTTEANEYHIQEQDRLHKLIQQARSEKDSGCMSKATHLYQEILKEYSGNWEAEFFSIYCSVYATEKDVDFQSISNNMLRLIVCIPKVVKGIENQTYTRVERLHSLGIITNSLCEIATNYFVAIMNRYKLNPNRFGAKAEKITYVQSVINMLVCAGNQMEEKFSYDEQICAATACVCWKIGLTCYENCNIPEPKHLHSAYMKLRKYLPDYRCSKPIMGNASNSDGCYIATSIYGSYDCSQVWTLRRYRDYVLAQTWFGRMFIRIYYRISPILVKRFGEKIWFKNLFKVPIDGLVRKLQRNGLANTPYVDMDWRNIK